MYELFRKKLQLKNAAEWFSLLRMRLFSCRVELTVIEGLSQQLNEEDHAQPPKT